ncbi:MAG: WG repeat-containing protein, partial [Pseudoflavonifractor sp.]
INSIEKLPDVDVSTDLGKRILLLYNAGVLTGSDEYGRFSRRGNPTYRSEAAAVISRVIQPELRMKFTPKALIPPVLKELPLDKADAYITGFDGRYLYATKGATGKKFIADLNGKILLETDGQIYPVQGDVVRVGLQAEDETYSTVYYSLTGKRLNEKTYASGTDFNDGLAAVQERQGGEISLMNTAGEVVRRFENKMHGRVSSPPSEGYFLVRSENANYMVKIETGEATKLGGLNVDEFSEGMLQVVSDDYKVGFRNTALEFAIPYALSASTEDFHSGLAVTMGEGGLFGAIGPDGKVVLPYQYRHLSSFNADGHAMATVEMDGLWTDCVIDKTGKVIQRFEQKDHSTFTLHGGIVVRGTIFEYHFYRLDGTEVVPGLVAQNFTASSTGRLIVEVDGKYYLIDAMAPE